MRIDKQTEEIPDELMVRWTIEIRLDPLECALLIGYAEGYTIKELAKRYHLPFNRARRLLHQAIQHARELFKEVEACSMDE